MSSDFLATRSIQHIQKPRRCFWCARRLAPGDQAVRVVGVWEHVFDVLYLHPECNTAWQRDPCHLEDEACPYDHNTGMTCAETTP